MPSLTLWPDGLDMSKISRHLPEGCPILTTCSSLEIGDPSGATRTSHTSCQVVNVIHFSEIT